MDDSKKAKSKEYMIKINIDLSYERALYRTIYNSLNMLNFGFLIKYGKIKRGLIINADLKKGKSRDKIFANDDILNISAYELYLYLMCARKLKFLSGMFDFNLFLFKLVTQDGKPLYNRLTKIIRKSILLMRDEDVEISEFRIFGDSSKLRSVNFYPPEEFSATKNKLSTDVKEFIKEGCLAAMMLALTQEIDSIFRNKFKNIPPFEKTCWLNRVTEKNADEFRKIFKEIEDK